MYLDEEESRTRTILSGAPLTAQNIRMQGSNLGSEWLSTSWFFLEHLVAKAFTRSQTVSFDAVHQTALNYGIEEWSDEDRLRRTLRKMEVPFNKKGLGNVETLPDGSLKIGALVSSAEFRHFASTQYDYAMGEGLTHKVYGNWERRNMSDLAERILWHYMMQVFDRPRVYDSTKNENHLTALYENMTESMSKKPIAPHGIEVWKDVPPHTLALLAGWERGLLSKNVLKLSEFGGITFIAPAFYADVDRRVIASAGAFSAEGHEIMLNLVEKLRTLPSYPVMKGTPDHRLAQSLARAGAVTIVEDSRNLNGTSYAYLVSRDVFEALDKQMGYRYSSQPFKDYGDSSITDLFFQALGRARLFGERILPEVRAFNLDYKEQISKFINALEQHGTALLPQELGANIFEPLVSVGAITIADGRTQVTGEFQHFITSFAEYWNQLVNDSSLLDIKFPPGESVTKKEESQTSNQIKKNLNSYF